jgi:acetyl esterase/lipase
MGVKPATLFLALFLCLPVVAEPRHLADIVYARPGGREVQLDLDIPAGITNPPLVVMVHGGGWSGGSRQEFTSSELVENGFAVATVDYRLSPDVMFPAHIEDVKAAVRFLRAHAEEYGIDVRRVGAWGSSAGAHLVSLLALAGPEAGWDVGDNLDCSSSVQAVVSWFGPSDFTAMDVALPQAKAYVLHAFGEDATVLRTASPIEWVHRAAPPFLFMHGELDTLVPPRQSEAFAEALRAVGAPAEVLLVRNAGHSWHGHPDPPVSELRSRAVQFFRQHLQPRVQ